MQSLASLIVMRLVCSGMLGAGANPATQPGPVSEAPTHGVIKISKVEMVEPPESVETGQYGNLLRTLQVNREMATDEEIIFDNDRQLWRVSVTDTRDRELLKSRMSLSDEELKGVSRTRTVLGGLDGQRMIIYRPERETAHFVQLPQGRTGRRKVPVEWGMIDENSLIKPGASVENVVYEGDTCKRVTVHGESESQVVVLHPRVRNRFREKTTVALNGSVISRSIAANYRQVDGYWIPFHFEEHQWSRKTGQKQEFRITKVRSVDLKSPPAPGTFSLTLPVGTSVLDDINGAAFRIGEPIDVTLATAPDVRSMTKRFGRISTQPSP